jgi:hypothetical protein
MFFSYFRQRACQSPNRIYSKAALDVPLVGADRGPIDCSGIIMQYRLVYDVLKEDGFPWFGVGFATVPLLLALVCLLEIVERVRGRRPLPRPTPGCISLEATPLGGLIVSFVLLGGFGVFFASNTYEAFAQRKQCQEWIRAGQYQVAEGTITDYYFRKGGAHFHVAGVSFDLLNCSAGFNGRFNVPRDAEGSLGDGLRVRLTHQDGFILRVEIAAGEPTAWSDCYKARDGRFSASFFTWRFVDIRYGFQRNRRIGWAVAGC